MYLKNFEGYFNIPGKDHEDGGTFMNTPAEGKGNTLIEAELNEGAEVSNGETYIYSKTTKHPDTGETFKTRKDKREKESLQIDKLLSDSSIQKDEYKLNALTRRKTTLLLEEESDRSLQDEIKTKNELKDTMELEGLLASNTNISKKGTYRKGSKVRKLNANQQTMLGSMLENGMIETYQNAGPVNNPEDEEPVVNTDDDLPFSKEIDDQGNTRYIVNGIERTAEEYDALVKQWNEDPENFATIPMAPGNIDVQTQTNTPIETPTTIPIDGPNINLNVEGTENLPPVTDNQDNTPPVNNQTPNIPPQNPLDITPGSPDDMLDDMIKSIESKKVQGPNVQPVDPRDPSNDPLTREILDQSDMQNPAAPATVENVDPLTREILDQSDMNPPVVESTVANNPNPNNGEVAPADESLWSILEGEQNTTPNVTDNRTTNDNNAGPEVVEGGNGNGNVNVEDAEDVETVVNNTEDNPENNTVVDNTVVDNNVVVDNNNNKKIINNNNNNNNNNNQSSSSSYKFMQQNINPYDWLGAAGLTHGALSGAANTRENYQNTPPNINFMKDVYKKPIHRLNMNTEIIDAANMNTDRQLREDLNTQLQRIRTSGNSFQNVDARSQNAYNTYASNAIDADVKYGLMNLGLQKDIADLEGKDRKMFLEGEGIRDVADRKDMDNYYTQRGKDIQNTAKNMMEMAKNGNASAMEWMKANAMNGLGGGNDPLVINGKDGKDGKDGVNTTNNNYNLDNCPGGNCPDGTQLDENGNVITQGGDPDNNNIINDTDPNNNTTPGENTNTFYNVSSGNNFETNFSGNYEPGTAGHFQEFARGMNLDLGDFGASGTEWEGVDNNIGSFTTDAWDISSNAYRDYLERSGTLGNLTGITEPANLGGTNLPFRRRLSPDAGTHSQYTNYGKFDNAQDYYNSLPGDQQQILKDNDPDVFGEFRRGSMVKNAMYGYGSKARRPRKYQDNIGVEGVTHELSDEVVNNYATLGVTPDVLNSMNMTQSDTLLTSKVYPNTFNYNSGAYEGEHGSPFSNPQLNAASSGVVMDNLNMGDITLSNSEEEGVSSHHTRFGDIGVTPVSRQDVTDDGTVRTTTDYTEDDFDKAETLRRFYATNKHSENSDYMKNNYMPYSFDFKTILNNEGKTDEHKNVYMKMKKRTYKVLEEEVKQRCHMDMDLI